MNVWVMTKIYEEPPVPETYVMGCYTTLEKAKLAVKEYLNRPCNDDLGIVDLVTEEEKNHYCRLRAINLGPDLHLFFDLEYFECDAPIPETW